MVEILWTNSVKVTLFISWYRHCTGWYHQRMQLNHGVGGKSRRIFSALVWGLYTKNLLFQRIQLLNYCELYHHQCASQSLGLFSFWFDSYGCNMVQFLIWQAIWPIDNRCKMQISSPPPMYNSSLTLLWHAPCKFPVIYGSFAEIL